MKPFILITLVAAMGVLRLPASQPELATQQQIPVACVKSVVIKDSVLSITIQKYLKYVGNYEIPILAIQTSGDTTHYILSAFISTYMIRKNPPAAIVKLAGREALQYSGQRSIARTAPACYQALLKKYSWLLHDDKLNRRDGRAPEKKIWGTYDPILKDIAVAKDGHVVVQSIEHFPFITYE